VRRLAEAAKVAEVASEIGREQDIKKQPHLRGRVQRVYRRRRRIRDCSGEVVGDDRTLCPSGNSWNCWRWSADGL